MGVAAVAIAVAVGVLAGAFVPFLAYRLSVPVDEPARDTCVSCGRTLPSGWLRWPARCAGCGTRLGPPAWLTAAVGGVSCGLMAFAVGPVVVLPMYVALTLLGILLGAVDLACRRLPHALVMPAILASAVLFTAVAGVIGDWAALRRAAVGALILGGLYFVLFLIPAAQMGFGDAKLAVLLGGYLGWMSWNAVVAGVILPWLLQGPVGVVLLLTRRIPRGATLPFGPALLAGAWLSILGASLLD